MAMIMAASVPDRRAEFPHQRMNDGKLVAIIAPSSTVIGLLCGKAHDEERHGDAVVEMGRDRAAAPDPCRRAVNDQVVAFDLESTPASARPAATAARRSDSFTRSSCSPCIRVVPSAKAAATARIGYSSIIDGARQAGTVTPVEPACAHAQVRDRLAAFVALVQALDRWRPSRAAS